MKVLVTLLFIVIGSTLALPTPSRSNDAGGNGGEPSDCLKECINGVLQYGSEISILKNSDFTTYFNKLDEICEVISTAKQCVKNCGGAVSNPFALDSLNVVCQGDSMEKIAVLRQCLQYIDHSIDETCSKECHNTVIDETDVTPKTRNPLVEKANADCSTFKCMARCNVEVVAKECGKNLGSEFQALLQQVLDTQRKDLEKLNLVETMAKTTPPQCNYLYDPSVLFGSKPSEAAVSTPASHSNPEDDAKTLYAQAQLQLLLKQIELAEKQDHLIDRENAKLDMEMSYMAHKAQQRDARFFQNAQAAGIPIFMPMEKMPSKESMMPSGEPFHMNMESIPEEPAHPEHPMEHGHQMPDQHEHAMPEEPSHHGQSEHGPSDEPQQHDQPIPEDAMSQQEHPQEQPEVMSPRDEQPKDSMTISVEPMPMMQGVQMEAFPMGGIPLGLPMAPMDAMPRFF